ncbi:MAG: hypothetical protein ABI360_06735 [Allobranchiibius sp.]
MSSMTERCWLTDTLAVTLARVDFLDPAFADQPDTRERGIRVEIRPVNAHHRGTIYSSPQLVLGEAIARMDLLESAPHAADRMHWHPGMIDGEPEDRTYDPAMPADPTGWLGGRLRDVGGLLQQSGVSDTDRFQAAAASIADLTPEIVHEARAGLAWAREAWPEVDHDERGMAVQPV